MKKTHHQEALQWLGRAIFHLLLMPYFYSQGLQYALKKSPNNAHQRLFWCINALLLLGLLWWAYKSLPMLHCSHYPTPKEGELHTCSPLLLGSGWGGGLELP